MTNPEQTDQPFDTVEAEPKKPRRNQAERAADDLAAAQRTLDRAKGRRDALLLQADEAEKRVTALRARVEYLAANPLLAQ